MIHEVATGYGEGKQGWHYYQFSHKIKLLAGTLIQYSAV